VNPEALAVIQKALENRRQITLQDLRRIARFKEFPEKSWYAALKSLEMSRAIEVHPGTTPGGKSRTVVLVKANG
jgi:hypothetical protein